MKTIGLLTLLLLILTSCNNEEKNMGLFDKLKKEKPVITSTMMPEDQFWLIIENSKKGSTNLDELALKITNELLKLLSAEIIGFQLRENKLRYDSYNSDLWCAGYIMNGGCSDDCFEYFRCWLIGNGKEIYYNSLKSPDSLSELYSNEEEIYEFEDLMYVASNAFQKKTGKEIDDFIDYQQFKTNEVHYTEFQFTWEEDNEESMKAICPKLMDIAWD